MHDLTEATEIFTALNYMEENGWFVFIVNEDVGFCITCGLGTDRP